MRTDDTFMRLYQLGPTAGWAPTNDEFVKQENPFHLNERLTTQQGVFLCPADLTSTLEEILRDMAVAPFTQQRGTVN